jgi:hypothetical protein
LVLDCLLASDRRQTGARTCVQGRRTFWTVRLWTRGFVSPAPGSLVLFTPEPRLA